VEYHTALLHLLNHFSGCFARPESHAVFQQVCLGWLICLRGRTLTEVWQSSRLGAQMHFDAIYSLFSSARWEWDDIAKLLMLLILCHLVPFGIVSAAVDDTLCHKRGQRISFGGVFLDPVLSTKSHKNFRYALNYVVVALVITLPFRPDRPFALPVLWRVFRKKGEDGHRKRTQLAWELVHVLAHAMPNRNILIVADCAYINATVLADLPANVDVLGPLSKKAALHLPAMPKVKGQKGRQRMKGLRLPTPKEMLANPQLLLDYAAKYKEEFDLIEAHNPSGFQSREVGMVFPKKEKLLRVQFLRGVLWYKACKQRPVLVAMFHDPQAEKKGRWRDEVLVTTKLSMTPEQMVAEYSKRWSIEVAFRDSKQYVGLEDPQVRTTRSVERAHPMAWFCLSLTILWYALNQENVKEVDWDRPWYNKTVGPTFTDMLGALRLCLLHERVFGKEGDEPRTREMVEKLLNEMAKVS
jgi:hypothetical protein